MRKPTRAFSHVEIRLCKVEKFTPSDSLWCLWCSKTGFLLIGLIFWIGYFWNYCSRFS